MASSLDCASAICNHLIVVCCHAIYTGGSKLGASEDEWLVIRIISLYGKTASDALSRLIEPFQKGETPTFIDHIKAGLKALAEDSHSLLVFSGYEVLHNVLLEFFSLIHCTEGLPRSLELSSVKANLTL
jgi:hypothetical protein